MKLFLRLFFLVFLLTSAFTFKAKATHIVGGDITVRSLGSNNFEITLTLFFDCVNGSPAAFDPFVNIGIFDLSTHAVIDSISIAFTDSVTVALGDSCFTPPNVCVRQQRYIDTINIPNNPNGYYLSWHRCCRNGIINNIVNPGASGNVFYVEIPDPALQNSSPTFTNYPDAYMCINALSSDTFAATDIDGDSLAYSFSDPYDCSVNAICGSLNPYPPTAAGPYSTVPWLTPYTGANFMGDPTQVINPLTGIITTLPPTLGLYVFCVQIDEFRAGVKIGTVRRDVQYTVLPCKIAVAAIVGPNPICLGNSTTLSATGGATYLWNTGQTTTSIILTPTALGTYTYSVLATKASCSDTADIVIQVNPFPVVNAAGNATICPGTSVSLSASGANTYTWSPAIGLNNPNISNPVANPNVTTNYTVTGTLNGCDDTSIVTVVVFSPLPPTVGPAQTVCLGANASLSVSGGSNYSWSPSGNLNNSTLANPVANNLTSSTTYTVTALDANGCPTSGTQQVSVSIPVATAGPSTTICMGATTNLSASSVPTAATYIWLPATNLSNPNIANPVFTPSSAGSFTYSVAITTALGCLCYDVTTVVVNPLPVVTASAPLTVLCTGQSTTLTATGAPSYVWSPAAGLSNVNISNPVASPANSTNYLVVGTLNGCADTASVFILVGGDPVAALTYTQTLTCEGLRTQFIDGSANASSWLWDFGDGSSSTVQYPPIHQYGYNGTYNVTLIVANPPCYDTATAVITIGDINSFLTIKTPNVFTPNADGLNDCFKPVIGGPAVVELEQCLTMEVFDRWGIKVFESDGGLNVCWDGKTKSNIKAKDGTYYYVMTLGETTLKGYLTLLREKD